MRPIERLYDLGRSRSPADRWAERALWPLRNLWLALRRLVGAVTSRQRRSWPRPLRLHVGCGQRRLEGWLNLDLEPGPGVDLVADVRKGLPIDGAEAVFAEHFLEHLAADEGLAFLLEVRRVLAQGGRLRLSTPNLDWVVVTNRSPGEGSAGGALALNRAFYGWGHRLLWDRELLAEALAACGFEELEWHAYGESTAEELAGLEGHARYGDDRALAHVLVVEAVRGAELPVERLVALRERIGRELLHHVERADAPAYWRDQWWRWRRAGKPRT